MKFVFKLILFLQLCLYFIKIPHLIKCKDDVPTVSVNYVPKKQWKMSKIDLADIKLDIERELKSKILQIQMDWENRQRMEEAMAYNQFTPAIPEEYFAPTNPKAEDTAGGHRFFQREAQIDRGESEETDDDKLKEAKMREMLLKTMEKIKVLKQELMNTDETQTEVLEDKIPKNQFNETNSINNIVQKYSKHSMQNEFDVFTKIFKNYNSTNMNSVDMNVVNKKIKNFVNPEEEKNNLRINKVKSGKI